MKKLILAAAVAGAVLLSSAAQAQTTPEGYQLQQVLMMSRHNLRAPLANNGSVLEQSTPNQWPEWDVPGGQLTTKGGVLEIYMGHYMREWLADGHVRRMPDAGHGIYLCQQSATHRCDGTILYHRRFPWVRHSGTSSGKNGHDGPNV